MEQKITVCIDPGHGGTKGTDFFREGEYGLREEEVNIRVALALEKLLADEDIEVILTRRDDRFVELQERVDIALKAKADLFVSIHHSVAQDRSLNYSIVYFHKNALGNPASVDFASYLAFYFQKRLKLSACVYSDYLVFPSGFHVLRSLKDIIPAVIGEASFLSHQKNELLLQRDDSIEKEAQCYKEAIMGYFENGLPNYKLISSDDDQDIIIELDDGFGGAHFKDDSLRVFINGKSVPHKLNIFKKVIVLEDKKSFGPGCHELYLQGNNKKDNNIHPKPYLFNNVSDGTEWSGYIKEGKKLYNQALDHQKNNNYEKFQITVQKAIEALNHSLRILPVHEHVDEVYYYLILCFKLIDDRARLEQHIKYLKNYVPSSEYTEKLDP